MNVTSLTFLIIAALCGLAHDYFISSEDAELNQYSIPFAFTSVICTVTAVILYFW